MKKEDYLPFCRYYKGEEINPYKNKDQNKAMLWGYERFWIDMNLSDNGRRSLAEYIDDYSHAGLSMFEMQDDAPASLKALLFNRYCHYNSGSMIECVEPFKEFYRKYYK